MTLEEIAQELGCSHQNVSQIENKALKKMKHLLKLYGITYEDLATYLEYNELMGDYMRVATVYYNENTDQTSIKYSDDFMEGGWVLRADVLKDLYGTIDTDYNKLFNEKPSKGEF